MKNIFKSLIILVLTISFCSCNSSKSEQTDLCGITYSDINEVAQLKGYKSYGYLDAPNSEFELLYLNDSSKNKNIIILEKSIEGVNSSQPNHQILDTINIDNIKPFEYINYYICDEGKGLTEEMVALAVKKNNESIYKIIKAWKVDAKAGKLVRIENTKRFTCEIMGFDPSGCDDYSDSTIVSPK